MVKQFFAADTIVVIGDNILGKPVHREDAVSMLLALWESASRYNGVVIRKGEKELFLQIRPKLFSMILA